METLSLPRAINRKYIEEQAKIFKALGHPSRLLMAEALVEKFGKSKMKSLI